MSNSQEQFGHLYGGYWRYDFVDFLFLTNSSFPSRDMYDDLRKDLPALTAHYPSGMDVLASLLSQWYDFDGFTKENLIVGNGTCELIRIMNRHIVKKAAIVVPSFNEYEDLEDDQKHIIVAHEEDGFVASAQRIIQETKQSGANVLVLVNPNNPTGACMKKEVIETICASLVHLDAIIVDESFIDFTGDMMAHSVQPLVTAHPNLVVLRSISKEFGVSGFRLGYMLTANTQLRATMMRHIPIWNINSIGEWFLEHFPSYREAYDVSIQSMIQDREAFAAQLADIPGITPYPSAANFILCKLDAHIDGAQLKDTLFEKHRILIKHCANKTSLDASYIRIAVKTQADHATLISALQSILDPSQTTPAKPDQAPGKADMSFDSFKKHAAGSGPEVYFNALYLPIANWLSYFFVRIGVTANQLTYTSISLGIVAGLVIASGNIIPGLLIFMVSYLFDFCDGLVARYVIRTSGMPKADMQRGKLMENVNSNVVYLMMYVSLGYALAVQSGDMRLALVGVVAYGMKMILRYTNMHAAILYPSATSHVSAQETYTQSSVNKVKFFLSKCFFAANFYFPMYLAIFVLIPMYATQVFVAYALADIAVSLVRFLRTFFRRPTIA